MLWKSSLESDHAKEWIVNVTHGVDSFRQIVNSGEFRNGRDLTSEQLDESFRNMKELVHNRTLARNLYGDNGLKEFNSALRVLLFGNQPLSRRADQFFHLHRVGVQTLSQFLCFFDPGEYPVITPQTMDMFDLDASQEQIAYEQAITEYSIQTEEAYLAKTLDYLKGITIYREAKAILGAESYSLVNIILRLARDKATEEVEEVPSTSVSLERDLRDYLAKNPHLLEPGLKTIATEYRTLAGNIDLLCKDSGSTMVIETKKGRSSDQVVGQILRYIGAIKEEGHKSVRGIIVLNEPDKRVDYAIAAIPNLVKVKYYRVKFELSDSF